MQAFNGLSNYFGDLHSHCDVGYGHGSLEDAYANAKLQLDFLAVTPHAYWHDMPVDDPNLGDLVAYHEGGFERTKNAWQRVRDTADAATEAGVFAAFVAYEWHSNKYGDHNVYFRGDLGEVFRSNSLEDLREEVRQLQKRGDDAILIPHHIGYRSGYRGVNWDEFSPEFSPVAEAMSMHGCAESPEAPYPYQHTMGSRDWKGTYQYGLAQGHLAGLIGSTDHHSGHPGSYGHGGLGVWSDELTRASIFDAIKARRTYAITGDKIGLALDVNGTPMGSIAAPSLDRAIHVSVEAGSAIDYVEVLHNNTVIERVNGFEAEPSAFDGPVKVHLEVGWGEVGANVDWDVQLEVMNGSLVEVQPRFRGHSVVAPQDNEEAAYRFSNWDRTGPDAVTFRTRTWGNVNSSTPGMQGMALTVDGHAATTIRAVLNGTVEEVSLEELMEGPKTGYLGGFLTPSFVFYKAVPESSYRREMSFKHRSNTDIRDWYTVRVRQHNGQWAWSSPVWVQP
jgi:hypothetical protein